MKNQTREERIQRIALKGEISKEALESLKIVRSLFHGEGNTALLASALYDIGKADGKAEMREAARVAAS